jgi:hypothetical protein
VELTINVPVKAVRVEYHELNRQKRTWKRVVFPGLTNEWGTPNPFKNISPGGRRLPGKFLN